MSTNDHGIEWMETGSANIGKVISRRVWLQDGLHILEGTIVAYALADGRRPQLFQWRPNDDHNILQVLTDAEVKAAQLPEGTYGAQMRTIVQERMEQNLHSYVHAHVLPSCVLQALLEESWSNFLQQQSQSEETQGALRSKNRPSYYYTNQVAQTQVEDSATTVPGSNAVYATASAIAQRIKAGAQLAYNYHSQLKQQPLGVKEDIGARRRSRRVTWTAPAKPNVMQRGGRIATFLLEHVQEDMGKAKQEIPAVKSSDDAVPVPMETTSNEATRVKSEKPEQEETVEGSTSIADANDERAESGLPSQETNGPAAVDTNDSETDGAAENSKSTKMEEDSPNGSATEPEAEKELSDSQGAPKDTSVGGGASDAREVKQDEDDSKDKDKGHDATGDKASQSLVQREREKGKKKSEDDDVILVDAHEEPLESEEDEADLDDDFEVATNDDESEDLENVVKEKGTLEDCMDQDGVDDDDDDDDEEQEQEDDDSNGDYISDNPFLQVGPDTVLDWLGRRCKSLTSDDIKEAIGVCMRHNLSLYDLSAVDQRALGTTGESFVLDCSEKWKDLKKLDGASFNRCTFRLKSDLEEQQQWAHQQEHEERLKKEKAWSSWRFKGIHGGFAVWPEWSDAAAQWVKENKPNMPEREAQPSTAADDVAVAQALEEQDKASRRSARRGKNTEGGVFYGSQSQMSQKKLMETIIRLCMEASSHTLMSLLSLIGEDSSSAVQRLRTAIGRLIWKRNQLSRCRVSSEWTDKFVWELIGKGPLCSVVDEESAALDDDSKKECVQLVKYIQGLHRTELHLRTMIMKCINDRPALVIASAADEKSGTLESFDSNDFDDPASIKWEKSGHEYVGKEIFRPAVQPSDGAAQCRWFEVSEFVESVEAEEIPDKNEKSELKLPNPPLKAERRMRFRAQPITEDGYEDYGEHITLTEGQVEAGLQAATLQRKASSSSSSQESTSHPFAGGVGTKVKLRTESREIHCFVVGFDTVFDNAVRKQMVMLLHDRSKEEGFWVTLSTDENGCLQCHVVEDGEMVTYQIDQADYDAESEAFGVCESIIDYLERMKHSNYFMEPVDPVALNIPSYFEVVKRPMDISTLASNLEKGVYSKIPPKSVGRTPSARMLNGPFKDDAVRIFDNAILFNPPDDFVHKAAQHSKKLLLRKIEQLTTEGKSTSTRSERLSIYVDEDSDVDMYEYESEGEDDDYASGKRKTGKRKRNKSPRDDYSTRMVEGPIRVQHALSEVHGLRTPLAGLPVALNPSLFSLPHGEWSCRYRMGKGEESKPAPASQKSDEDEMAEMLTLQRQVMQSERNGLRRSNRSSGAEDERGSYRKGAKKFPKTAEKLGIEYFSTQAGCLGDSSDGRVDAITNRVEVESYLEDQHESLYANLYQKHSKKLSAASGSGMFDRNSFPPYLGRVVPSGGSVSSNVTWEIREDYLVAAVRWVLRGLVASGHLTALEPMSPDAPLTSGVVIANDVYYFNPTLKPFDQLELRRKKKEAGDEGQSSDEDIELSEYEKLRKDRVARNQERLKMLGLA